MIDLSTTYMGLKLAHPLLPSASPLARNLDGIKRLEDAGAPAIVLPSLFEEQIEQESHSLNHFMSYGAESFNEATTYFPEMGTYNTGPDHYLELIHQAKKAAHIPIIASLNGVTDGAWIDYARRIQQAGADALELNIYYVPADPKISAEQVERRYIDALFHVKRTVTIPVAVKLSPYFSAMGNMAKRLSDSGANALVLFNRFYQPDFDLDNYEVVPHLVLSNSDELRLPLRWIAILYKRVASDLALTTGVHTHLDAIKGLMAGSAVVMLASELLANGTKRIGEILHDLQGWMAEREYVSVRQMRGSMSQAHVRNPAMFERANYMKTLDSWRPDPVGQSLSR